MASIFDINIQKAQGLRFVNMNESSEPQTRDNRLFADLRYPYTTPESYCQKYEKTDPIRIQYRTDYEGYEIYTVSESGTRSKITSLQTFLYEDEATGLFYYDLSLPVGLMSVGKYCVLIELYQAGSPIVTFQSEPFYLKTEWENTLWIECYGVQRSYDDNMYWVDRQGIRVTAMDKRVEFSQSKNVDENINNTPRTLKAKPNRAIVVEFDKEPEWIYEKINIFLNHDEFYINNIQYNTEDPVSIESLGKLIQYKSTITLIESEYQNGESKVLTGDTPPEPPPEDSILLSFGGDLVMAINSNTNLKIN